MSENYILVGFLYGNYIALHSQIYESLVVLFLFGKRDAAKRSPSRLVGAHHSHHRTDRHYFAASVDFDFAAVVAAAATSYLEHCHR